MTFYNNFMPPQDIIDAAFKVSQWMESQNQEYWQLGNVCDRRFAYRAEQYSAIVRKIAFEYGAGGYNSEGLLSIESADGKLRWIIEDIMKWPKSIDNKHYRD